MSTETLSDFKTKLHKKVESGEISAEEAYEEWIEAEYKETALVEAVDIICDFYTDVKNKSVRYELIKEMIRHNPVTQDFYEDAIRLACEKIGY